MSRKILEPFMRRRLKLELPLAHRSFGADPSYYAKPRFEPPLMTAQALRTQPRRLGTSAG